MFRSPNNANDTVVEFMNFEKLGCIGTSCWQRAVVRVENCRYISYGHRLHFWGDARRSSNRSLYHAVNTVHLDASSFLFSTVKYKYVQRIVYWTMVKTWKNVLTPFSFSWFEPESIFKYDLKRKQWLFFVIGLRRILIVMLSISHNYLIHRNSVDHIWINCMDNIFLSFSNW